MSWVAVSSRTGRLEARPEVDQFDFRGCEVGLFALVIELIC
jgi:hypothetical protein